MQTKLALLAEETDAIEYYETSGLILNILYNWIKCVRKTKAHTLTYYVCIVCTLRIRIRVRVCVYIYINMKGAGGMHKIRQEVHLFAGVMRGRR